MKTFDIDDDDALFIGEDKSLVITVYQADGRTVQDITGWALSYRIKTSLTDADAADLVTKTTSDGITLTTPSSGICTISIADTDTDALSPVKGWHELKRTDAGSETVLFFGRCVLRRGVHRS